MKKVLLALALSLAFTATHAQSEDTESEVAVKTTLKNLYKNFRKADQSTLEMKEYGKLLEFDAVVLTKTQSLKGNELAELGASADGEALARASFHDDEQIRKLQNIEVGQKVHLLVVWVL